MSGEQLVDVSYRGLSVGTSVALRDFGPTTAYLEVDDPMPVGSVVDVTNDGGEGFSARVTHVREKTDSAPNAGMRIFVEELPEAVRGWWSSNVSQEDPPAATAAPPPEPHPAAEPEPEPEPTPEPAAEAVPEAVPQHQAPQQTQVMPAVDISQIEALGARVSSEEFAQREAEAAEAVATSESEPEAEADPDDDKKRKKKRRKKKKKD